MSTTTSTVISEHAHVKFNVLDTRYSGLIDEARGYVKGLLAADDKMILKFREIVVCRSVLSRKDHGLTRHDQHMWSHPGPFTSEQLLQMMQYPSEISSIDWYKHMIALVEKIDKPLPAKL